MIGILDRHHWILGDGLESLLLVVRVVSWICHDEEDSENHSPCEDCCGEGTEI